MRALSLVAFAALSPPIAAEPPPKVVVRETVKLPDRYKRRTVRFTPHARPDVGAVHRIIGYESARWNVSAGHLSGRIACESGFHWWASNGQYRGLGQFAYSTFTRGLWSMPRGVRVKRSRVVKRHKVRSTLWSDGTTTRKKGRAVNVRRTRIYVGRIRHPDWVHGWAQVRIMAQAMAGRGSVNDSEWECR